MVALRCRSHCRTLGPLVILMESISGSLVRNMRMSKPLEVIFRNSGGALPVPPAARLMTFYGPCLTHLLASSPHSWEQYERKSKPGWICHRNPNGLQVLCHWYQQWQGDQGGIRREKQSVAPPWVCLIIASAGHLFLLWFLPKQLRQIHSGFWFLIGQINVPEV